MIEKLGKCKADFVQSRPVQIAKHNSLPRFFPRSLEQAHLRREILPGLAVVNEPVHPGPKLRVHRVVKLALPPKIKREVGIEMRKNDAREQPGAGAFK